jgi:hypothetical protein
MLDLILLILILILILASSRKGSPSRRHNSHRTPAPFRSDDRVLNDRQSGVASMMNISGSLASEAV